ncbi:MAG: PDZ domain-containing protein [Candidatus Limnocylindria bacterium]|nr:PDZ domain-containing protein [Candidatus Limnocylindria bacterium]
MEAGGTDGTDIVPLLEDIVRLERQTEELLARLRSRHPDLATTIETLRASTARRREAVQRQRRDRAGAHDATATAPRSEIQALYGALGETFGAYAELHAAAHRAFDSLREGSTADLAEAHLRECAAAMHVLDLLVSDVTVAALDEAGRECRCRCPACGLGLCLCAPHGATTVRDARRAGVPEPTAGGLRVRRPRHGSAADHARLRPGDVVVAIDGATIAHDLDAQAVQRAIDTHASGDEITLHVERAGAGAIDLSARRP